MKKKLLFMLVNMNVGGTEKALLNMISNIPEEKYDVTILMLEKYGEFLSCIPSWVNVEYIQEYENLKGLLNEAPQITLFKLLKERKIVKAIEIMFFLLISKIMQERSYLFNYVLRNYQIENKVYDIAVAYAGPMDFISFFVATKIKAKKRIQWIHFDVTKIGFNKKFASKIYKNFDKIFVVSREGRSKLTSILPNLKNKTENFSNILSSSLVNEMAEEGDGFQDNFTGIRILTVGRLSKEKGQDLSIPVLERLKKDGFNVKWYCIGEGNARKVYENIIKEFALENDFILLGSKPNPYPFIKQCDIYVQNSRHEGYCITLSEAKCLHKPIITTNFAEAKEQISHRKTGLIINKEEELYYAIKLLLNNMNLRQKLSENLKEENVDTTKEIVKFLELVEENS
ncbi:glycosyltransferase [Neobacillus sp. PS3-34]|uniref:glycosyltransferase n=1 Tax=Neobacillus sp. PS3-34 TaxID=3070678 RepID=UPI0027DFFDE2|nr:glycosyltransferase [Neobacillus sp. PS3-34]WML47814.1 glycosyltransferase [Neobacillus sp. PS3-34]